MKKSYDEKLVEIWLQKSSMMDNFDTTGLKFSVCKFEKGEYLNASDQNLEELLFVVDGAIQIYGVREDGRIMPVNQVHSPAIIGDMEFTQREKSYFFVQAQSEVFCLCLPMEPYRKELEKDVRFLHMLLQSYADKLKIFSTVDLPANTMEEKVLLYMKNCCPSHELNGINAATLQMRCSRRQLQRVLKKLCDENQIEKIGRGKYRIVEE